jgi:phenylacetate-CoA ligase
MGMPAKPWREGILDEAEVLPMETRQSQTLTALKTQLERVFTSSPFHRARFSELGFEPGDLTSLQDVAALPLMGKTDHQASLAAAPPFGNNLGVAPEDLARVHFSSGTTGQPTPVAWTTPDRDRWTHLYARGAYGFGVRASDVYQCLLSFAWFVGGLGSHAGFEELGATGIPGGNSDSVRQLETMRRFGTTFSAMTPSFAVHLAEVAEEHGIALGSLAVDKLLIAGEPGGSVPATRKLIEELWQAKAFDGYGSLEFQPIAWECTEQAGLHLFEDYVHAEVLDLDTGARVADGGVGQLILTHLDKQAHPFVRWATGDVVQMTREPCACGRTTARLLGGVRGRADDMLVVRGVNLFPAAIEDIVRSLPGTTGEYLVMVDDDVRDGRSGHLNAIKVQVEMASAESDDRAIVAEQLGRAIRSQLHVRAVVVPVEARELPRATHKAVRIQHS